LKRSEMPQEATAAKNTEREVTKRKIKIPKSIQPETQDELLTNEPHSDSELSSVISEFDDDMEPVPKKRKLSPGISTKPGPTDFTSQLAHSSNGEMQQNWEGSIKDILAISHVHDKTDMICEVQFKNNKTSVIECSLLLENAPRKLAAYLSQYVLVLSSPDLA
jgi:hypothetical protein